MKLAEKELEKILTEICVEAKAEMISFSPGNGFKFDYKPSHSMDPLSEAIYKSARWADQLEKIEQLESNLKKEREFTFNGAFDQSIRNHFKSLKEKGGA